MSDFTSKVMSEIMGDDGTGDEDAPISPYVGTANAGRAIGPEEIQPTPPGKDEVGYELVPYVCWKCNVADHMSPHVAEAYQRHRVLCLPCQAPHRWKWKTNPDTGERFLYPDPRGRQPRKRLGEDERQTLERRATELLDLQLRRDFLRETILKMQAELSDIEPRIVALTVKELPAAQDALVAIETDPQLAIKQKAADVAHEIGLVCQQIRKEAKKQRKVIQR